MYQAKVYLKALILLFVVFMGCAISSPIRAESPGPQTEPSLYGAPQTIRMAPQPELGFFYPYYLYIPDNTRTDMPVYMLVEPNNSGTRTDDSSVLEQQVKSKLERGYSYQIASRMGFPLLMPVFPLTSSQPLLYPNQLNRNAMLVKEGPLRRIDLQLTAMIHHAQKLLREKGLVVHDKVLLEGFSSPGFFVNRFAFLHPEEVKAVASGGMKGIPMLPFSQLNGEKLIYPIGVYDLKEITGSRFQLQQYKKVPQLIYQGYLDTDNDPLPAPECFGPEEVRLVKKVLGEKIMPDRWEAAKNLYKKAGVAAQFVTYSETYHELKDEIIFDIIRFFQANMGEKYVPLLQPYSYPPVVVFKKAHIKDILLLGSEKIPASIKIKDCHFIISIDDLNILSQAQVFDRQLRDFIQRAGFDFEIIEADTGNVVCKINKNNYYKFVFTLTFDFQGYAVKLREDQIEELTDGKTYTLRPLNSSDTYQWLNDKGVTFVWRNSN